MKRNHELYLINLGLEVALERMMPKPKKISKGTTGKKWTSAQRKKFAATMAKKFDKKF